MPLSQQPPTKTVKSSSGRVDFISTQSSPFVHAAIILSMLLVLVADLTTPLGIAVWIVYLIPVSLSLLLWNPQMPLWIAVLTTMLMVVTFLTDDGDFDRNVAQINRGFGVFTIWIMAITGHFFVRNRIAVRYQQWLQSGRAGLSLVVSGEKRPEEFGDKVLTYLVDSGAQVGALFAGEDNNFHRIATYGVPSASQIPAAFTLDDGLMGQAAKTGVVQLLDNVPEGYLRIGSSLGEAKPRNLLIAPVKADGSVNAVVELGFMTPINQSTVDLLEYVSEPLSVAVRSSQYRAHLQNLLEETQRQAEELQVQSEELRVANEEMEEQSRALQESQSRLEQQQIELEQTNVQLEEQAQQLEIQRDDVVRAQAATEAKAHEVERASRYKSDFLANMSHELRTPLNSSLILAKLLADNSQGNLTSDQVTSAETILSAGRDLLSLINDILDLSKIEAGRMEVRPEEVWLEQLVRDLTNTVRPLAEQKGLEFVTTVAADCPEVIETDRQRLEQVLKNLLSNATKFTDRGRVSLNIKRAESQRLAFEVSDTGIGIPEDQQRIIFEAFRQVDSAANRKYSGTGLGLSISRELARLLGGEISVSSQVGAGSTFTILLPTVFAPVISTEDGAPGESVFNRSVEPMPMAASSANKSAPAVSYVRRFKDDRELLTGNKRVIMIVEDDESFARILFDLAHEQEFQCLVATTAEEGIAIATQHLPSAVVLDIGLPDHSGLSVLDRLKHDSRTRHIPVHVVSADDYTEAALSLGAVGYMLKPVTREKLLETLQGLESRLVQRMRRVLVVEDDAVQLDSMRKLLGTHDVETVGASSAAECLELLRSSTFDCMVLDLTLPDATGFSLLETLSREDAYSFPPVIVYTGRDLSAAEEHQLRRYSKSIIIKGAKSPERLLDEVTLFLHQVVADLPAEHQQMIQQARSREALLEGRRILVVEDDVRNVFALTSVLEPRGAIVQIARNGREAIVALEATLAEEAKRIDLVLMDVMMPEMDGITATKEIRKRPEWAKLPIIMLTAKAMKDDQENCISAGANDYMAKPLDVDKLLSLVRVWIRR